MQACELVSFVDLFASQVQIHSRAETNIHKYLKFPQISYFATQIWNLKSVAELGVSNICGTLCNAQICPPHGSCITYSHGLLQPHPSLDFSFLSLLKPFQGKKQHTFSPTHIMHKSEFAIFLLIVWISVRLQKTHTNFHSQNDTSANGVNHPLHYTVPHVFCYQHRNPQIKQCLFMRL